MSNYEIRPYEPADRRGYRSLFATVFDKRIDDRQFAWKYENNPYVDHVPIIVATDGSEILGARSFFALPVAWADNRTTVLQPCDTMVHPDHRRQGLFTRMTEHAIDRYKNDYPFFFNFPNQNSLPGNLKLGWRKVSERTTYYRIEDLAALLQARLDNRFAGVAGRLGTAFLRGYYRLREVSSATQSGFSVREVAESTYGELADVYRQSVPEELHVVRDEEFYEWRLGSPASEYTAYITEGPDDHRSAIVTGTSDEQGVTKTRCVDIVPLNQASEEALISLLDRILADHGMTDLFSAPAQGIPRSVLRTFAFHADSRFPLSILSRQTTHVVRSLDGKWKQNGIEIDDPVNWVMTFAESDSI